MEHFLSEKPIYMQIMERIKKEIIAGKLQNNDTVSSVRELAVLYQVNPNTVQRALSELEKEGYLRSDRTRGRYVSADETVVGQLKATLTSLWINQFVDQCIDIGLDYDSVCEIIHTQFQKKGKTHD